MANRHMRAINWFNNLSFRKKLLVTYAIILLIPVTCFVLILNRQTQSDWVRQSKQNLLIQVGENAEHIEQGITQNELSLSLFALNGHILTSLQQDYKNFYNMVEGYTNVVFPNFTTIKALMPQLQWWRLYTNGPLKKYGTFASPVEEIASQPFYEALIRKRSIMWYARGDYICQCIRQPDYFVGNRINILVFGYQMQDVFSGLGLVNVDHAVEVFDAQGEVVYRAGLSLPALDEVAAGLLGSGSKEMEIGDKQYLVIEQKLDFGWGLRYFVPSSALLEGRDSLLVGLLALLLLLTALLMGLSVLLSRVLIGRVELLSRKVNAVVSTGTIEELHVSERDEIGVLSNSVAQMIEESQRMTRMMYESKIALREAEIELLQMQIKPHFLYNTLSLINWRAIKSGDHEISQIALMLTQFYRTMLNNGRNVTLVSDEWMTVEAYLHIQLLFHNRNFDADTHLDERISPCHMPNLLLQPLVENAIEHGLDKLRGVRGRLRVTGSKNGQMLHFEIQDNGPGFSEESLRTARTQHSESYGLKNIDERLRLLYSDRYVLSFTNLQEGGALVVLEIPQENCCGSPDVKI